MTHQIGVDVTAWYTADEMKANGRSFALGSQHTTHDGKVYTFVKLSTGGVTGDGYVCSFGNDFLALMVDTDTAGSILEGDWIGVAEGAGDANDYGWLQVYGPCGIRSEQDALANKKLGPTADAGQLDDAAAVGIFINGIHLGTATGGADAVNSTGFLNYPTLEVQMEPETT
jgi:hypothetical protein